MVNWVLLRENVRSNEVQLKKTRTDKSEVALQPTDLIHPVKLGAHSIYLSTGVGCRASCEHFFTFSLKSDFGCEQVPREAVNVRRRTQHCTGVHREGRFLHTQSKLEA